MNRHFLKLVNQTYMQISPLMQIFDEPNYHIKCEVTGYNAVGTQPYFEYIKEEEKQDEVAKSQLQYIDSEAEVENLSL